MEVIIGRNSKKKFNQSKLVTITYSSRQNTKKSKHFVFLFNATQICAKIKQGRIAGGKTGSSPFLNNLVFFFI